MNRPNLFSFATSELSQDAFICWLLSWADPKYAEEHPKLHECGEHFLRTLMDRGSRPCPEEIQSVEVLKQFHNIDILAIVNKKIPLLIEDKTNTKNHSDQLETYKKLIVEKHETSEFAKVYFKTGDQALFHDIKKAGYGIFKRGCFLEILEKGREAGIKDEIFVDFHDYLAAIEAAVAAYSTKPVSDWDWSCWTGFFLQLQQHLEEDCNWDYVPNPSGGFMGLWWHEREKKYLQLEQDKLCFKLEVPDTKQQSAERDAWHHRLMAASDESLRLKRPQRFGRGTWMTAAQLDGQYLQSDAEGRLDFEATLAMLRRAEALMDKVLAKNGHYEQS